MEQRPISSIGPFELVRPLGAGSAGEVWEVKHPNVSKPLALKLIRADSAQGGAHSHHMREVSAVSRLLHPHIIEIYEQGFTTSSVEVSGVELCTEGTPYFVMEHASLGTLKHLPTISSWSEAATVLVQILDGLAHAHAHGLVHRDLKPTNILAVPQDGEVVFKLSDFGLALDVSAGGELPTSGTPSFMAPEQIRGEWRRCGPWTDLYALGCLATWLVSGELPFPHPSRDDTIRAHLYETPPALHLRMNVPEGFEAWRDALLRKEPQDRFHFAADAAWALAQLVSAPATVQASARSADVASAAVSGSSMGFSSTGFTLHHLFGVHDPSPASRQVESERPAAAPWVPAWTSPSTMSGASRPPDAGLSLYGLRHTPFVGREASRDRVWEGLGRACRDRRVEAMVFSGESGAGKTHLVTWMARRAHALGSAHVLTATHNMTIDPRDGLPAMFCRALGIAGLEGEEARAHLARRVWDGERPTRAELTRWHGFLGIASDAQTEVPDDATIPTRMLRALAGRRGLILIVDDAQWAMQTLRFVKTLLSGASDLPLLILLTVRAEALPERPQEAKLIKALPADHHALELLSLSNQTGLIRTLLPLSEGLAEIVAARTSGNPLFAVHLIGDWVARSILEPTPEGFRVPAEASLPIPESIHEVLERRVESATAHDPHGMELLQLAAVLGLDISIDEWGEAARHLGYPDGLGILRDAEAAQLGHLGAGSFTFAHGMQRESLLRGCREMGAWRSVHAACAKALAHRQLPHTASGRGRLAAHFEEAGEYTLALQPYFDANPSVLNTHGARLAREHLASRQRCLDKANLAPDHPHVLKQVAQLASVRVSTNSELAEAREDLERILPLLEDTGLKRYRSSVMRILARAYALLGELERFASLGRRCLDEALADGDVSAALRILYLLARHIGPPQGHAYIDEALRFEDHPDFAPHALILYSTKARLLIGRGKLDEAEELLLKAEDAIHPSHHSRTIATMYSALGDLLRARGKLKAAKTRYTESITLLRALNLRIQYTVQYNLGLCTLEEGDYLEARAIFKELIDLGVTDGEADFAQYIDSAQMATAAGLRRYDAFDRHLEAFERDHAVFQCHDPDLATNTELAARLLRLQGEEARALEAFRVAIHQWVMLRNEASIVRVEGLRGEERPDAPSCGGC